MVKELMHDPIFLAGKSEVATKEDLQVAEDLLDTLTAHKDGCVGMAANMIGVHKRIIAFDNDGTYMVMFNPEIIKKSGPYDAEEGCLSLPAIHEKVKRPTRIRVSYLDDKFQPHDEWVSGYLARVMQHEFDHLDGVVFTDHLTGLRKQLTRSKLQSIANGRFSCNYKVKARR